MVPAMEWVKDHRDNPFFLFLHAMTLMACTTCHSQRSGITEFDTDLDGSIEEQAALREQGLATIVNPGDAIDLTSVLDEQDAAISNESTT